MRKFSSGATRDIDDNKLDFEGFLSPIVLKRYAEYLHQHRKQADGQMRDSDNWQKGIPKEVYAKSLIRHIMEFWMQNRGYANISEDTICAAMFNLMGYLYEHLHEQLEDENGRIRGSGDER